MWPHINDLFRTENKGYFVVSANASFAYDDPGQENNTVILTKFIHLDLLQYTNNK